MLISPQLKNTARGQEVRKLEAHHHGHGARLDGARRWWEVIERELGESADDDCKVGVGREEGRHSAVVRRGPWNWCM